MSYKIFFLLLFLIITGCVLDSTINLGDKYVYFSEGVSYNEITKQYRNSSSELVTITIPRSIIDYKYNNFFITALQVPIEKEKKIVDEEAQLKNPKKYNYWIIDKKKDILYGPLEKENFIKKSHELSIPYKLKNLNVGNGSN